MAFLELNMSNSIELLPGRNRSIIKMGEGNALTHIINALFQKINSLLEFYALKLPSVSLTTLTTFSLRREVLTCAIKWS